jgi:hypothetical protein
VSKGYISERLGTLSEDEPLRDTEIVYYSRNLKIKRNNED